MSEPRNIIDILEESRSELKSAVSPFTDTQGAAAPSPEKWSVLQCLEHVIAVEERFYDRLQVAERIEAGEIKAEKEADLTARVTNRVTRFEAPEPVRPQGRFSSVTEAIQHFDRVRTRTESYAEANVEHLPFLLIDHPRFGKMNGRELLVVLAGHARRHAAQIRECASTPA